MNKDSLINSNNNLIRNADTLAITGNIEANALDNIVNYVRIHDSLSILSYGGITSDGKLNIILNEGISLDDTIEVIELPII